MLPLAALARPSEDTRRLVVVPPSLVREAWDTAEEEACSRRTIEGKSLSGRQLDDVIIDEISNYLTAAINAGACQ
jgi:hypothetical protein